MASKLIAFISALGVLMAVLSGVQGKPLSTDSSTTEYTIEDIVSHLRRKDHPYISNNASQFGQNETVRMWDMLIVVDSDVYMTNINALAQLPPSEHEMLRSWNSPPDPIAKVWGYGDNSTISISANFAAPELRNDIDSGMRHKLRVDSGEVTLHFGDGREDFKIPLTDAILDTDAVGEFKHLSPTAKFHYVDMSNPSMVLGLPLPHYELPLSPLISEYVGQKLSEKFRETFDHSWYPLALFDKNGAHHDMRSLSSQNIKKIALASPSKRNEAIYNENNNSLIPTTSKVMFKSSKAQQKDFYVFPCMTGGRQGFDESQFIFDEEIAYLPSDGSSDVMILVNNWVFADGVIRPSLPANFTNVQTYTVKNDPIPAYSLKGDFRTGMNLTWYNSTGESWFTHLCYLDGNNTAEIVLSDWNIHMSDRYNPSGLTVVNMTSEYTFGYFTYSIADPRVCISDTRVGVLNYTTSLQASAQNGNLTWAQGDVDIHCHYPTPPDGWEWAEVGGANNEPRKHLEPVKYNVKEALTFPNFMQEFNIWKDTSSVMSSFGSGFEIKNVTALYDLIMFAKINTS
eukprot:Nk52_evm37s24 gene=Nk52_evmTU37s24